MSKGKVKIFKFEMENEPFSQGVDVNHQQELAIVCQCHKCGHLLYLTINDRILNKIADISITDCPNCGEEGEENWILRGVDDWNNRKIF